jgi:hypothetical protein
MRKKWQLRKVLNWRKAHIPLLKEIPLGEYPSLAGWIKALTEYHTGFHINHMKEILQGIGGKII